MTRAADEWTRHSELLRSEVEAGFDQAVRELSDLVRIPSVSWDAFDPAEVHRSAEHVAELARQTGFFERVTIEQSADADGKPGQPAVLAYRPAPPGAPHVVLYAHHDVQPPGDEAEWDSPPFEPVIRDGRLYGRGAADDKAGVLAHLAAIRSLQAVSPEPAIGVTLFIEGEEEFGSRSFDTFLSEHRDVLAADAIVVADSDNPGPDVPALTVALRGNVTFRVRLRTLEHASHSGMWGGAVPDAVMALARLIDSCYDEDGSVAIAGLNRTDMAVRGYDETQLRAETGLIANPIGRGDILSRLWAQPSVTVTGIDVTRVAEASNTLIPAVQARFSVRVAPGQTAQSAWEAVRSHLEANPPFGAELSFDELDLGEPFLVDTAGWAVQLMKSAMTEAWGGDAVESGIGGSIPFISSLAREYPEAQILVTGVEDPHTRAHSPNESLHLGVFKSAILTEALFLAKLSERTAE